MPDFSYKAIDTDGSLSEGVIAAVNRAAAYRLLRERWLQPISVGKEGAAFLSSRPDTAEPISRLSHQQLLDFTEELAELLEAGLQLEGALRVIEQQQDRSPVRLVASRLRQHVRDGVRFSVALKSCGRTFDPLYCNLVAAAEAGGALPQILKSQCSYLELIGQLKRKVISSLLYPAVVFSTAILLLFIFLTYLVPQLAVLLSKTGHKLPLVTQVLIDVSSFCGHWWWAILATIGLLAIAFRAITATPSGRIWWHRVQLDIPLVGRVIATRFLAEILQTLATLVTNGVPLLQGLQLLTAATANVFLRETLAKVSSRVGEGSSLAASMRKAGFFPPVLIDILSVGEQTGDIAAALERAAKRYDRDLTTRITHLTTLIQPAIIAIVALFVGLVAYSMIVGILTSVSSLRTR